jgi:DNA repair exonuclease SbcCD nuclease subunit
MLLGIFSDSHLGFGGEDRFNESFERFVESIQMFKENKVDYILHAGDLFDESTPTQEVWLKTFECFSKNNGRVCELKKVQRNNSSSVLVKGIPIIGIHGTHEHRGKDFANALDILEESECLVHLHAGFVELNKDGEKVCIHGMGGVPEKFAKQVFSTYNPQPVKDAVNLLLLHQSFIEFLPFDDESIASLSLADLPEGFDLIIDGHLHWTNEQNLGNKRFLLTGSAIFTQMKSMEAKGGKGIFLFDTSTKKLNFVPFKVQRKLLYEKLKFENAKPEEVTKQFNDMLENILSNEFEIKPLIRIKLSGTLAKGFTQSDISLDVSKYKDKAVFSISKDFSVESFQKKIEALKLIQNEKKSVVDFGINILEKNVEEAGLMEFDTRRVFDLLCIGENDKVESILVSKNEEKIN